MPGSEESEDEGGDDVDYAVVSSDGMMKPEIEPRDEPAEKPQMQPVQLADRGIRLQTSRLSYAYTYVLALLVAAFFFLAAPQFGMAFYVQPQGLVQTLNDVVCLVFAAAFVAFAGEADFERMMRSYVITNTDVVRVEGILRKRRTIIPYQSVSNVTVYKGILGRILNFGDVNVIGFDAEINIKGVRDPDTFYRIINNKIARMRGVRPSPVQPAVDAEQQPSMDWRSEQRSLGEKVKPPVLPSGEPKSSIFGLLKSRVLSKAEDAADAAEEKPALKPRRKPVRRAAKKPRG
jgi:membrane protein YdbS with pleckstrin-like domain